MKRFFIALNILLFSIFAATAQNYVFDEADILSDQQESMLNSKLIQVSSSHGIGIYVVTINDYHKFGETVEEAAEAIYQGNDFGIGELKRGLLLLLSMRDRTYDLDSYNNNVFGLNKRGSLENAFLDDFRQNSWYSGFVDYADTADSIMSRYEERKANGEIDEEVRNNIIVAAVVIAIVCLIFSIIRLTSEKKRLNNIHFATDADSYESENGVNYSRKEDKFSHTTTRTIVHEESNSSNSGGGGGHSHSSGSF